LPWGIGYAAGGSVHQSDGADLLWRKRVEIKLSSISSGEIYIGMQKWDFSFSGRGLRINQNWTQRCKTGRKSDTFSYRPRVDAVFAI